MLVIANLVHASPRIPGLVRYLPQSGWEVVIVTPQLQPDAAVALGFPEGFLQRVRIVEAPYKGDILWPIREMLSLLGLRREGSMTEQIKEKTGLKGKGSLINKLLILFHVIFAFPDAEKTWQKPALEAASKEIRLKGFDAILSSSPYPTSHLVAAELKRRFRIPWIADFRDLWSENHNYPYPAFRQAIDRSYETKAMRDADAFLTVDAFCAGKIRDLHGHDAEVIPNGFDMGNVLDGTELSSKFTITYTGTIYFGKQYPARLFEALEELISEGQLPAKDIEVRFFGSKFTEIQKEAQNRGLSEVIVQYGPVPRSEAFLRQRESQLLLLFNWEDEIETELCPLKFFEYMAAKRPVLATGGYDDTAVKRIMDETEVGAYSITKEEIKASILKYYGEYAKSGAVCYRGKFENVAKYSYQQSGKRFAEILDGLLQKGRDGG